MVTMGKPSRRVLLVRGEKRGAGRRPDLAFLRSAPPLPAHARASLGRIVEYKARCRRSTSLAL
jgi:hypothetical protein